MLLESWYEVTFGCKVKEFGRLRMEVRAASSQAAIDKAGVLASKFWDVVEARPLKPEEIPNG